MFSTVFKLCFLCISFACSLLGSFLSFSLSPLLPLFSPKSHRKNQQVQLVEDKSKEGR